MDRRVAESLLRAAVNLDAQFGMLDTAVNQISDEAERKAFAKELGDLVGAVNEAFIRPIVRQYPELDPDVPHAKP